MENWCGQILIISSICLVPFLYIGVPWIYGRCLRLLIERKAIKTRVLVLTFDDGPGSRLTPAILDILEKNNAKATFFLLGKNIEKREAIVRQILSKGHEIGSHGYEHLDCWKVSPFRSLANIKKGWQAIDKSLGITRDKYPFRPPYGRLNIISLIYLLTKKVPICYWTIVSGDTWIEDKRDIQYSASVLKTKNGGVILAHDFDRSSNNTDQFVIESLKGTIAASKENSMKIITFAEMCD